MEILALRLRWIAARKDRFAAEQAFARMLARISPNPVAKQDLAGATLRAARTIASSGRWVPACRLWMWHAQVSGEKGKAARNIVHCARSATQQRSDEQAIATALDAWALLLSLDPQSKEARQGIAWCHARLARWAERKSDFSAARSHWAAVLVQIPRDKAALDGVRRAKASSTAELPASRSAANEGALALYERLKRRARSDYSSQCAAGRLLLDAGAPELALRFLEPAFRSRKGAQAAELVFRCCVILGRFSEAAAMLPALSREKALVRLAASELQTVLSHIPGDLLGPDVLEGVAGAWCRNPEVAGALLPHLIARNLSNIVVATVNSVSGPTTGWPVSLVLETARYLLRLGQSPLSLRLLALFSADPEVGAAFSAHIGALGRDETESWLQHQAMVPENFPAICLALAEHEMRSGEWQRAADLLSRMRNPGGTRLGTPLRHRLGDAVVRLLSNCGADSHLPVQLAQLVVTLASEPTRRFFAGAEFAGLCTVLAAAARLEKAPAGSRLGLLREHYFEHHFERRENQPADGFESEFALCDGALRYFETVAGLRAVEQIPVSSGLRTQLGQPRFGFGNGGTADLLMSYAILRSTPDCDLNSSSLFESLAHWYVERFMPQTKVPSVCMASGVLAALNAVLHAHSQLGVSITLFADHLPSGVPEAYDLGKGLDALLFSLETIATSLPDNAQYRPLFSAMLPPGDAERPSFFDLCVAALAVQVPQTPFSALLAQHVVERAPKIAQYGGDILLIGHGGEGTGLSRNFSMLKEALEEGGHKVTTLSYELAPERFAQGLRSWRTGSEADAIVIAAVNAHDIPSLFIRDRHEVLTDCCVVGFFLWETSVAPKVQHLGIAMVDEIWTPTRYVAAIYAPFGKPVHVVGKGLPSAHQWPKRTSPGNGPARFLTVFDFHSSIERKNPLASVLAFQKAFQGRENVELIVKTSNVDPQNPANASGQWERLCDASARDGRIHVITERYTDKQMRELMCRASCVVSLHRAEGFGYVLSDAMALGIPVIGTDYSGNVDFCDADTSYPVAYRLVTVEAQGAHWEAAGTMWADAEIESAAAQMLQVYRDYPEALRRAALGRRRLLRAYSKEAFAEKLRQRLAAIRAAHRVDPGVAAVQ